MQKSLTLLAVKNETKTSKAGKQYRGCSILIQDKEGKEIWFNMFATPQTEAWQKGDTVLLEFYEDEYNGVKSWKAKPVSIESQLDVLKNRLEVIEQQLVEMAKQTAPTARQMLEAQGIATVEDKTLAAFDNINSPIEPKF